MKLNTKFLDKRKINYEIGEKDNLTVGGYLDLRDTNITALPDNLTVGGYLDLQGTNITASKVKRKLPEDFYLKIALSVELKFNAKGFTIADGILARVLQSKDGIKKVLIVGQKVSSWLASDNDGNHAHGKTISEAVSELAFKKADKTDLSDLENMPLDTEKNLQEWGFVYRRATGACKIGVEHFITANAKKETYTLAEILEETKSAFGHQRFKEAVNA